MASRNEQTSTVESHAICINGKPQPSHKKSAILWFISRCRYSTKWKIWFQAILLHLTLQLCDDIKRVEFICSYQLTYITFLRDTLWKSFCCWVWDWLTILNNAVTVYIKRNIRTKLFRTEQWKCFASNS